MATLVELAASIVESHASTTKMTTEDLLQEIEKVYGTLKQLETGSVVADSVEEEQKPALSVRQAIKQNEIICMICGKGGMNTLTRHLSQDHGMKPGEYRKQFGIKKDQPLAAKSFSEARKKFARERGMADILAKAREVRMSKINEKKASQKKPGKTTKASKSVTA